MYLSMYKEHLRLYLTAFLWLSIATRGFSFCTERLDASSSRFPHCPRLSSQLRLSSPEPEASTSSIEQLKKVLLECIDRLQIIKCEAGDFSIDFGVRGGELNATSRAPQKVDFYAISKSVGEAADAVISVCESLASVNPTLNATLFLGDGEKGDRSPLEGAWKLLFTTAADATFSANSTRGNAKVQNVVNGKKGTITNVIDFIPSTEKKKSPVLQQLNVVIKATALNENRVGLQFKYAKAVFSRFFFFPIKWNLYIPVPGPFITRIVVFFNRLFRRRKIQMPPKAYFDVLYLDKDLRIHKTGEDNLFVQARESWTAAQPLLE